MHEQIFTVNKTSFEMFDVFRAYGLADLLTDQETTVRIQDLGHAYLITTDGEVPESPDSVLFENSEGWNRVFETFRERKDSRKPHPRTEVRQLATENLSFITRMYSAHDFVPSFGRKVKDGRTLYQSLDVSACKGFREGKRSVYHDGTQLMVDKYSWLIACIGAARFGVWREGESFIVSLVPNPADVYLSSNRTIQGDLDTRVCPISANTALAHYAVRLAIRLAKRQLTGVRYNQIIFNVMKKTRQQAKPGGGGQYSFSFLQELACTQAGFFALEEIDRIFPISPYERGVKQGVALVLADFLLSPTLVNLRGLESLYIRGIVKGELYPWEKDQLGEILKHVQSV